MTTLLRITSKILQYVRPLSYSKGSKIEIKQLPYRQSAYSLENLEMHAKQRRRSRKVKKVIKNVIQRQEMKNKFPIDHPYDYQEEATTTRR
nr:unnamed protein product [Callosobruchus chinensis]